MAVTTRKVFKEQVQKHVIEALSEEHGETVQEQLQAVMDEFNSWYGAYEQKRNPNRYEGFKDWCLGLPSCFNVEYTYYSITHTLKAWFEGAGETYKERRGDQEEHTYYHLVTREFEALCKRHGVDFW